MTREVEVAVVGAGTAGLNAMAQVRRVTKNFVLINGGELGTTCARVGCMPSKAMIQVADDFHRRRIFSREGIEGGEGLRVNLPDALEHVRDLRDILVDRVLGHTTDVMGDEFIEGYARFVAPGTLEVGEETIKAKSVVLACGTRPVIPEAWEPFSDRILTTDSLFEQEQLPESVAVIGLGAIGLEMGQSLSRMGVDVTGIDVMETIGGIEDPVVNQAAVDIIGKEFPLWLGQPAEISEADGMLRVDAGDNSVLVEKILVSMGRRSNLDRLDLENAGLGSPDEALAQLDLHTMQIGQTRVFICGDANGERQILHEAGDEGRVAGYNAARPESQKFARKTPLMITFADPNIAMVGVSHSALDSDETVVGEMRMGPVGRALLMGSNKGILRIYADQGTGRLLGICMIGPKAENLAHLVAWAISQNMTLLQMLRQPFYHPTIEEALQGALRDAISKAGIASELEDAPPDLVPLD